MTDTPRHFDPLLVMTLGGAIGGLTGFALWMATETFVFLPVFLAIGLVTGISIAETRRGK
jgi:hypothetical protein